MTFDQLIPSHKIDSKLNKSHQVIKEGTTLRATRRGTERRGTAEGEGLGGEGRRRIGNRQMKMEGLILQEGPRARTVGSKRSLRRVKRIEIKRNRSTLRALRKMKSPLYLRTRTATDN